MANDENVVEILLAYGFSKEESEKAARLAAAYLDETQRKSLSDQEKYWAKIALEDIKNAKALIAEKAKLQEEAAKEAADNAIEEEKRVTAAAKKEYEARLKSQTETIKKVGLVAAGIAAAASGVLYKALGYAQQYIAATEDNTQLTERWGDATKKIDDAQQKIGKTLAEAILPALEKAADLVTKVADWMEANPEAVSAGLKGIAAIATMATIVATLSSAILVAQRTAVVLKGIEAAMAAKAAGTAAATVATAGTAAATVATAGTTTAAAATGGVVVGATGSMLALAGGIAAAAAAAIAAVLVWDQVIDTTEKAKESATGAKKTLLEITDVVMRAAEMANPIMGLGRAFHNFKVELAETEKALLESENPIAEMIVSILGLGDAAQDASEKLDDAATRAGQIAGSENEGQIVAAYQSFKEAQLALEQNYDAQILAANAAAKSQMLALEKSHSANVTNILKNAAAQISAIMASIEQAAVDYAANIAQIQADGQAQLEEEERNHQENLRKLAEEHAERVTELTNSRDALGLAQENRDYKKRVDEENRRHSEAERRIRESIAKQLENAKKAYEEQLAAQEKSLEEAEAARDEALSQEQAAYEEQKKQIEERQAEALRAAKKQYDDEKRAQTQAFARQLYDLGVYLKGYTERQDAMYKQSLEDVQAWATAYAAALASATEGTAPVKDSGGYATRGTYRLAQNGVPEFVLSGGTTKMAEKMLGGSLTQGRLLAGLTNAITLNDHRRFDSRLSVEDRNMIRMDTVKTIREMMGAHG